MELLSVGIVTVVVIVDGRIGDVRLSKIESVAIRAERQGTVDWGRARERGGTVWRVRRRDVRSSRAYHRDRIAVIDQRRRCVYTTPLITFVPHGYRNMGQTGTKAVARMTRNINL